MFRYHITLRTPEPDRYQVPVHQLRTFYGYLHHSLLVIFPLGYSTRSMRGLEATIGIPRLVFIKKPKMGKSTSEFVLYFLASITIESSTWLAVTYSRWSLNLAVILFWPFSTYAAMALFTSSINSTLPFFK